MPLLRSTFLCSFSAILCLLPGGAHAVDDYGVISSLETKFEVGGPTVTEFKGRKMLYMHSTNGSIYFAGETKNGWTEPKRSFFKEGFLVSDPSIIKHPKSNQYFMFYTMRLPHPVKREVKDRRTGKTTIVTEQPKNAIGVAYATACDKSPDGSGLCWTDVSKDTPLIRDTEKTKGGRAPSVTMSGTKAIIYYKSNPPESRIVRSSVDIRDWKIESITPLTFQTFDIDRKKWETAGDYIHAAINNVDVKPYGDGYMMVGGDSSVHTISRWKSTNGINFYYDPFDGNSPILSGKNAVGSPYLEPVSDTQFRMYYAFGDAESECSKKRQLPCRKAIQVRLMTEEKNPKIYENYYFDEDFKAPEYPDSSKRKAKLEAKKKSSSSSSGKKKEPETKEGGSLLDRLFD